MVLLKTERFSWSEVARNESDAHRVLHELADGIDPVPVVLPDSRPGGFLLAKRHSSFQCGARPGNGLALPVIGACLAELLRQLGRLETETGLEPKTTEPLLLQGPAPGKIASVRNSPGSKTFAGRHSLAEEQQQSQQQAAGDHGPA